MTKYNFIINYFNQGKNYLEIINWIIKKAFFKNFFKKPFLIIVTSGLRLVCQASAISIIYFYANALKNNGKLSILTYDLIARDSIFLMWMIIIGGFLCFAMASIFQYLSKIVAISLAKEVEIQTTKEALMSLSMLPDNRIEEINRGFIEGRFTKIASDSRRVGMLVRTFGYSIPVLLSGLAGAISIFVIEPLLTLFISVVSSTIFLVQYPSNKRGAKYSKLFENNAGKHNRKTRDLVNNLFKNQSNIEEIKKFINKHLLSKETINSIDGFCGRVKILEESTLINQIGTAIVISLTVFIVGMRLIKGGEQNWGLLLTYIISLRITMTGVVTAGRAMTSVSRFYPQMIRQFDLNKVINLDQEPNFTLEKNDSIILPLKNKSIDFNGKIEISIPCKIGLYSTKDIDRCILFIMSGSVVKNNHNKIVKLTKKPFFINNNTDFLNFRELYLKNNNFDNNILFIRHELLNIIEFTEQKYIFDKSIVFILYDKPVLPEFNEDLILLYDDFSIQLALYGNNETCFHEIKELFNKLSKKSKDSIISNEYFNDDDDDI